MCWRHRLHDGRSLDAARLVTYFVMKVAKRKVHFAGCTTNPTEAGMQQMSGI